MKKNIVTVFALLFVLVLRAQETPPGPPPLKPPSIEERLKRTNELFLKEVVLTESQQKEIELAFKSFFAAEDKLRKENPPPPPPPPDPKVKEAMDKLVKERDEQVKKVLSEEQFKKYKEAADKMHPPGPPAKPGIVPQQ